jgi:CRP-like cAMP-binding protein
MKDKRFGIQEVLSFSIFRGAESQETALEALTKVMVYQTFPARAYIIDEKVADDRIYLLLTGEVEVNKVSHHGKIVPLGRVNASTQPFFGESALLGKAGRISNVVARTECNCLTLRAKDFETFMRRYPDVGVMVYRNMASLMFDRLSKADSDLLILSSS